MKHIAQRLIIWIIRPYTVRELWGWGYLQRLFFGFRRDQLWQNAPTVVMRDKSHGHLFNLDLRTWQDRITYFIGRWYDLQAQTIITKVVKPGDTVIDVGANQGFFALPAAKAVGDAGQVICFEPNPKCRDVIAKHVRMNHLTNIVVHDCGLGDEDAELPLAVPFYNSGEGTFVRGIYSDQLSEKIVAKIRRGDDVVGNSRPSLIKVDVQGYELFVLRGLSQTIARTHPTIITEIELPLMAACGTSFSELSSFMTTSGYIGYKLGLTRANTRYRYELTMLPLAEESCDAIWVYNSS